MCETRRFGSDNYWFHEGFVLKADAKKEADKMREIGYRARVGTDFVRVKGRKTRMYRVFLRSK